MKNYVNGVYIREKKFENGGEVLNISINTDAFLAALIANKDGDGYAHFVIGRRREVNEKGISHSMWVSEWHQSKRAAAPSAQAAQEEGTPF